MADEKTMSGRVTLRQRINRVLYPAEFSAYKSLFFGGVLSVDPLLFSHFYVKFGDL